MVPTTRMSVLVIGVAALFLGGCAADAIRSGYATKHYRSTKTEPVVTRNKAPSNIDTGSIEKTQADPVTSKQDPRWQWCEQRHIDHQAGKAPGGATDLAKKLDDDRLCAAVYSSNQ